eukprot:TRINITY_DN1510_c0_g1_i1.p1 TRINITY_DN1510_c0_g1~~TRINITY_DN1510_c0_g1_i1.p1  ORF type:complete len:335 (+),score=53.83 TRINITY_DN1510_c0_g1_i1:62-1066(+)
MFQRLSLPLLLTCSAICIFVLLILVVERYGLVALLFPCSRTWQRSGRLALQQPLSSLLRRVAQEVLRTSSHVLRVAMLVCFQLDADHRKELLEGLDPSWRLAIFCNPASDLLPWPLRRLLFGRDAGDESTPRGREIEDNMLNSSSRCQPDRLRLRSNSMMELVRGMDPKAAEASSMFIVEKILAEKVLYSVRQAVHDTFAYGKTKAYNAGRGAVEMATHRRTQVTTVAAFSSAAVVGATGATIGLMWGSLMGAVCGVVPAVFTFGFSIPIGAVIGGTMGTCTGAAVAGSSGFFAGGALAYHAYSWPARRKQTSFSADVSEHGDSSNASSSSSVS